MHFSVCNGTVKPGLPQWLSGKESACSAADVDSISELGRSPVGGNGNPFQYSCLENPMDKGAWRPLIPGVAKSKTTEQLSMCVKHEVFLKVEGSSSAP